MKPLILYSSLQFSVTSVIWCSEYGVLHVRPWN